MPRDSKKYGKLYYEFVPSLRKVISDYFIDKTTELPADYGVQKLLVPIPPDGIDFFHFALVIDGEVKEVIRVNKEIANLFNQDFQLVEFNPAATPLKVGAKFVGGKFVE